jgi:hypothetical protein
MKVSRILLPTLALLAFSGFGAVSMQAEEHPAYLHALSDLRLMRAYLDRPAPGERINAEEQYAIDEINEAIREIQDAAISDGKPINYDPPVDARLTPGGRFRHAREAGNAAWHDLDKEEDNGWARDLKHRAMKHIENANHTIDHIISQLKEMRERE